MNMDKKIVLAKLEEIEMLANEWDDPQLDDFMGMVNLHHILNKTKYIQRELDSKIVMPKLFDEWVKSFALDSRYSEHNKVILINALGSCVDNYESMFYFTNIPEGDVMARWLFEDLDNRTLTCVDAILNGYEVKE